MTITKNNRTFLMVVFVWLSIILSQYINFLRPTVLRHYYKLPKFSHPKKSRNQIVNFKPKILRTSPSLEIRSTFPPPWAWHPVYTELCSGTNVARNNQRINYPLKHVLVALQAKEEFDFDDVVTQFCISWLTMYTCHNPLQQLVNCWNFHRFPGNECVPLENMLQSNGAVKIPKELVPTPEEV